MKKLSPNLKRTISQIFLKVFAHTSASNQFKTKIGNYNTNSFLSLFSLLKYLHALSSNFIIRALTNVHFKEEDWVL